MRTSATNSPAEQTGMHQDFPDIICHATGASKSELAEVIQELWSGYGTIRRYRLSDAQRQYVIVKHVQLVDDNDHPRGWNTDLSHRRKLRSYQVEQAWYRDLASRCNESCRVPQCLTLESRGDETLMVMEDLDESGFPERHDSVNGTELTACIHWLANFHALFMNQDPQGLWSEGTYWHLETRPDELEALTDLPLKTAAASIDQKLRESRYRTLVHGDAKLANFCFSEDGQRVAAVDFQYVGGGCGMKDVAYFIGSCLDETACERREAELLDLYFAEFRNALGQHHPDLNSRDIETEWRTLFPWAWTDFHRFLKGWCPGHWKLNDYSEHMARKVLTQLAKEESDQC
jgi:hypothetical protein